MFYTNTEKSFDELNKDTSNKITPQFRVGDTVKILPRNDLTSYLPSYVDSMQKYAGQLARITKIESNLSCAIDLDNGKWAWPTKALQLVTSETDQTVDPHNLKNGDYIKITNGLSGMSFVYLFKEIKDDIIYRHASCSLYGNVVDFDPEKCWHVTKMTKVTYATEKEKKLLDNALLEQGYKWNNSTKQLDSIGEVNVSLTNTYLTGINVQPLDLSSIQASIQNLYDYTKLLNHTKEEPQTETELNLFPTKKHYQLNFDTY